jgi:adenylate kinase
MTAAPARPVGALSVDRPVLIVVTGPPGAGKGSQCSALRRDDVVHLSTGDALRDAVRRGTPTGRAARELMERGDLVPDDIVNQVVFEALDRLDARHTVLLDGFPRTCDQVADLHRAVGAAPDAVIELSVTPEVVRLRLEGRVVCDCCGRAGAVGRMVGDDCDDCAGTLVPRPDDGAQTVAKRLSLFERTNRPVIDRLRDLGAAHLVIDAEGAFDAVSERFRCAIDGAVASARRERRARGTRH